MDLDGSWADLVDLGMEKWKRNDPRITPESVQQFAEEYLECTDLRRVIWEVFRIKNIPKRDEFGAVLMGRADVQAALAAEEARRARLLGGEVEAKPEGKPVEVAGDFDPMDGIQQALRTCHSLMTSATSETVMLQAARNYDSLLQKALEADKDADIPAELRAFIDEEMAKRGLTCSTGV